jgi:hypothetical protein
VDDELLVEEKRKNHRDDDRCRIVEGVEEAGGNEDFVFHVVNSTAVGAPWIFR